MALSFSVNAIQLRHSTSVVLVLVDADPLTGEEHSVQVTPFILDAGGEDLEKDWARDILSACLERI